MSTPPDAPADRAPAPSRWRRRLLVVFTIAVGLLLALRALLPLAIAQGIGMAASRLAGLDASVEGVHLTLWRGELAIAGLAVTKPTPPDTPPGEPVFAWRRVAVRLGWKDLLERRIHLRELRIEAPVARLASDAGGNIDTFGLGAAGEQEPPALPSEPEPEPSPPWTVRVDRLTLLEPDLRLADAGGELAFLGLDALVLAEVGVDGSRVTLAGIELASPVVRVHDRLLATLAAEPEPAAPPPPDEPAAPWSVRVERFALASSEVSLVDADGEAAAFFGLDSLDLTAVRVGSSGLALGNIAVGRPVVRVNRDLLLGGAEQSPAEPESGAPPVSEAASETAAAPEAAASEYRIEQIGLDRAEFTLLTARGPLDLTIALSATEVRLTPGERFPIRLELGVGEGRLLLVGELGLDPVALTARLRGEALPVPLLLLTVVTELDAWLQSCRIDGDLQIDLHLGLERPVVRVEGDVAFADVALAEPEAGDPSLGWKRLELGLRDVFVPLDGASPIRVALGRIRWLEPNVSWVHPPDALEALAGGGSAPPPSEEPEPEPAGPAPVDVEVDAFELRGGALRFRDRSVNPYFQTGVTGLDARARGITWPVLRASDVSVSAQVAGAPVSVTGSLGPGDAALEARIERLPLPPVNPYATPAGYRLEDGALSLETSASLRGEAIAVDNDITLHELDVETFENADFEGRFGLSIDMALALLRGPGGDIALRVPLESTSAGLEADVAAIVAAALRQALIGALSSPLKMIGAVISSDAEGGVGMEPFAAVAGSAKLSPAGAERVEGLARLLAERPELGLALVGAAGEADRPILAERALEQRAAAGESLPDVGAGFFARRRIASALSRRASGETAELDPADRALLARYVAATEVPEERLRELAQRRAERLRERLATEHGVRAERLDVRAEPFGSPGVVIQIVPRSG